MRRTSMKPDTFLGAGNGDLKFELAERAVRFRMRADYLRDAAEKIIFYRADRERLLTLASLYDQLADSASSFSQPTSRRAFATIIPRAEVAGRKRVTQRRDRSPKQVRHVHHSAAQKRQHGQGDQRQKQAGTN